MIGMTAKLKVTRRMIPTEFGPRPFTDLSFEWQGETYGCRVHGSLTPGEIEAERAAFVQRRRRERETRT